MDLCKYVYMYMCICIYKNVFTYIVIPWDVLSVVVESGGSGDVLEHFPTKRKKGFFKGCSK